MSNPPDTTTEALQSEIERLRAKNAELLGELKAAKASATDAQTAAETVTAERDAARAEVRALRLDEPVNGLLRDVAVDADLFAQVFGRHYRFDLDDQNRIAIFDQDGNPATVVDMPPTVSGGNARSQRPNTQQTAGTRRPATFTADDVRKLAEASPDAESFGRLLAGSRASGGGASGMRGGVAPVVTAKPDTSAAPQPFGIR